MKTLAPLLPLILLLFVSCGGGGGGGGSGGTDPNPPNPTTGSYIVLAWNDLGMHCLNPTYDKAVILPPYNVLWAQVVKVGNPPQVVTSGVTVTYRVDKNTTSYGKRSFGGFWDNAVTLFGSLFGFTSLPHDVGLKGKGLSGTMDPSTDHFIAEGIPVVPYDDSNTWNPYQVAIVTVKNSAGATLAETRATIPTSDEMHCDKCHGASAFADILAKHDARNRTTLSSSTPVLCASCHGDPALGLVGAGSSGVYLSKAMHGFHADKGATCYDCHPGALTQCSRSVRHTAADGNCATCHGTMADVASSIPLTRTPWASEPKCAQCHPASIPQVDTEAPLYRRATGHGNLYCESCHQSPHAMIPSLEASDNYQALQYQGFTGKVKSLGSCGVCHDSSRGGGEIADFAEEHGGASPQKKIGCHMCHTTLTTDTTNWPHGFQWQNSN